MSRDESEIVYETAEKAARAAHKAIYEEIEKDGRLTKDAPKIGAYMVAASMFYHNAICHAQDMGADGAHLFVSMFKKTCAKKLAKLLETASEQG